MMGGHGHDVFASRSGVRSNYIIIPNSEQAPNASGPSRAPTRDERDRIYAAASAGDGVPDMDRLETAFRADLKSGNLTRMRNAIRMLGRLGESSTVPRPIELSGWDAQDVLAALTQNIVPSQWKEGPWEARTAASESLADLAALVGTEAVVLAEDDLTKILKAIDVEGKKAGPLGGQVDFVALGRKRIKSARALHATLKTLKAGQDNTLRAETRTVGDASTAHPEADIGGKRRAGAGSLFALQLAEKAGR